MMKFSMKQSIVVQNDLSSFLQSSICINLQSTALIPHGEYNASHSVSLSAPPKSQFYSGKQIIATSKTALWKKREKLSDKKGLKNHFTPKQLLLTAIKQFVVVVSMEVLPQLIEYNRILQDQLRNLNDEENDDIDDLDEFEIDWAGIFDHSFPKKLVLAIGRSLSIETIIRTMEDYLLTICSIKTVDRLVRNPIKSAMVKASKYGRFGAAWRMLKTGFYSHCMFYSVVFCFDSISILVNDVMTENQADLKRVCRKAASKAYLYTVSIGGVVLGGAIGTAVWPGKGTTIGIVIGDLAGALCLPPPVFLAD
mmetsp:Transcript_31746/g.40728  ORF Transcript_31746/g.40728 Transcript_31746/m.40728 type:complete len:309 (+) Transcript_31746:181-1107(+)|eukprot:CAMPEP_0117746282 /NCGR_PEP_ID=MMETSP0947-20121206/7858_1 /TAXON_ID=44440 /ORGANISM="Chattonella subsalsa, Strain CCMP2191" /LENGTH=308 /DNA_ID=CAMNT_0005563585 /DNA_START=169 /DNA_END=1095 /DNA_ORIENTATION=+